MKLVVHRLAEVRVAVEILHTIEPLVDLPDIAQREDRPPSDHASAHRRDRMIDDVKQARALLLHRLEELQGPDGEAVETYVAVLLDAAQRGDMRDMCVLGQFQILHDGPCGNDAVAQVVHAKTLEVLGFEMLEKLLSRRLVGEDPVVEFKGDEFGAKLLFEVLLARAVVEHLLRLEVAQEFLHIVVVALSGEKLSRGNIKQAHTASPLTEMDGGKKVVLLVVEHVVSHGHARRHEFGNAALHHLVHLRKALLALDGGPLFLRILQLVADGHTLSSADEFRQIGVEGMVGKTRHLRPTRRSVVATRERDAQDARSLHRVVAVGLIEVAAAEEQQRLGVLLLHREKLPHHGGKSLVVCCHSQPLPC